LTLHFLSDSIHVIEHSADWKEGLVRFSGFNSFMSQTHSAWLDFALGYGVPGLALLMLALILAWRNSKDIKEPWGYMGRWGLGVLGLVMFTTEISSEIFINALIFMVVMITGLNMSLQTVSLLHANPKQRGD
jgi:O-antigen ligase